MIKIRDLNLQYRGYQEFALNKINLQVKTGELVLMTGSTGCGKSTFLNCLNGIMHYESNTIINGTVFIDGQNIQKIKIADLCKIVGTVFQNPESQICTSTPESEIAFGLENMNTPREIMHQRIEEALNITGLSSYKHQQAVTLSGGQKQRLMLACVLALKPKILLLDEPISQLDPQGAQEILNIIYKLKKKSGLSVIMIEHRIEETMALADRVVVMDKGAIISDMKTRDALHNLSVMRNLGLNLPHLSDLFERLNRPERPMSFLEAPIIKNITEYKKDKPMEICGKTICKIKKAFFRYNKNQNFILKNLNLSFKKGEHIALMGSNGAGKSTLLNLLAKIYKPTSGHILWSKDLEVGMMMQHSDLMLFSESVYDEIAFAVVHSKNKEKRRDLDGIVRKTMDDLGIIHLSGRAPFSLSKGQRLRIAVASIFSKEPSILLLDEPTTGQDKEQIENMMEAVKNNFDLIVFCTHDVDTAARYANRIILMDAGQVIADGSPINILFNKVMLKQASIRQTSIQLYSERHGVRALSVDCLAKVNN